VRKLKHPPPTLSDQLNAMSDDAKEHMMQLVDLLLQCYGPERTSSAVLIVQSPEQEAVIIASANADDMEAATLVAEAHGIMGTVLVADAPPREMFN
jgi:hypothetical protein